MAVKLLRPELAAVLGAERFVQEIETTANLQHPHILPLFDSGEADGFLYYVMPYIDGETLRDKLNRETQLGIEEAVKITTEVADALDYAHRQNVIHRDIKPANILLHDGRPMVADFGIAPAVNAAAGGRMTETGLSLGTPHYMSPEQATAEKDLTNRSDIYSLGSVLYEMLTGSPPHVGSTAQQVIMKIVTDEARPVTELRRSVPPHVAAATAKSLEKLEAGRFESAAKFAEALTNPAFTALTTKGSAKPAVRRLRVSVLAAAVILIAATAIGAVAIIRGVGADAAAEGAIPSASIAVLPFLNLSSDPEQEYFSDGLAEEILNVLAQIPNLHVTSRSSAFSFRGQAIEIPEVAARLGVAHVLEGSVQKVGTRVRITAQLIEAVTDRHLWSKRFEREMELSDVFAIQDEISTAIVEALTATMGLETAPVVPERQVVSVAAYDLFLKGLKAFSEGTTDSRVAALSYFERVIALEPSYAAAHYQLARTYLDSRPRRLEEARAAAQEAIRLDPDNGGAYAILGLVATYIDRDFDAWLELAARSYELAPNDPFVVFQYARAIENVGRAADAEPIWRRAIQLDPLEQEPRYIFGYALSLWGRPDEGLQEIERIIESSPDDLEPMVYWYKGAAL